MAIRRLIEYSVRSKWMSEATEWKCWCEWNKNKRINILVYLMLWRFDIHWIVFYKRFERIYKLLLFALMPLSTSNKNDNQQSYLYTVLVRLCVSIYRFSFVWNECVRVRATYGKRKTKHTEMSWICTNVSEMEINKWAMT